VCSSRVRSRARGGWSGQGTTGTLAAPDYVRLPAALRLRDPASDPLPPTRLASQRGLFYLSGNDVRVRFGPNAIVEDTDSDPDVVHLASTLDTLIDASSTGLLTSPAPVMTYYHGRDNAVCLFSGFDLWSWTRSDARRSWTSCSVTSRGMTAPGRAPPLHQRHSSAWARDGRAGARRRRH